MRLQFLNRHNERRRLSRALGSNESTLVVLFGRRRCGKSRLIEEVVPESAISFVGDDREASLQRRALASEIGSRIAGFDQVVYPDWDALLQRFWKDAPADAVLVLDEFPNLVKASPELPSLLQKLNDEHREPPIHLVLCGSSQQMMQGLVLDRTAPLYGRANEILRIEPLLPGWITEAFPQFDPIGAVEAYSVWGGVPRYWELAKDEESLPRAIRDLVIDPLGVLHEEPAALLRDDLRDVTQAASILSLIGRGCHRLSELASRLEKPASSLSRPMQRLFDLGLVQREQPFGADPRSGKRSLYRIANPFLRFWFRYVEPERSRVTAGAVDAVVEHVIGQLAGHVAATWEDLARNSVIHLEELGSDWEPAQRWWGPGLDHSPLEIDVLSTSRSTSEVLVGEVKWTDEPDVPTLLQQLDAKIERLPLAAGRPIRRALWLKSTNSRTKKALLVRPHEVLEVLR